MRYGPTLDNFNAGPSIHITRSSQSVRSMYLHAVVVLMTRVPLPMLLRYKGFEVGVADVLDAGGEPQQTTHFRGVIVSVSAQTIGLAGQTVLFHGALKRNRGKLELSRTL